MLDKAIKLKQHQEQQQSQQVEKSVGEFTSSSPLHQSTAAEQPEERKKKSNEEELDNEEYPHGSISCRALPSGLPIREVTIPKEIERSVSELTMRSHGAFELHGIPLIHDRWHTTRLDVQQQRRVTTIGMRKGKFGSTKVHYITKCIILLEVSS